MNVETAKMSERGQIIIPIGVREEIGARTNTLFAVSSIDKETIVMKKINTGALVKEFRRLRGKAKKISSLKIEGEIHAARSAGH